MAASVDGRVPYLNAPRVDFEANVPLGSRFDEDRGKRVPRALARRPLPADVGGPVRHPAGALADAGRPVQAARA